PPPGAPRGRRRTPPAPHPPATSSSTTSPNTTFFRRLRFRIVGLPVPAPHDGPSPTRGEGAASIHVAVGVQEAARGVAAGGPVDGVEVVDEPDLVEAPGSVAKLDERLAA